MPSLELNPILLSPPIKSPAGKRLFHHRKIKILRLCFSRIGPHMAISFTKSFALPLMLTVCSTIFRFGSSTVYNYPAAFNFGDSNSDTGELVAGKGFSLDLPYGQNYFNTSSSGRFCNGRLIVDFLSKISNTPFSLCFYISSLCSIVPQVALQFHDFLNLFFIIIILK